MLSSIPCYKVLSMRGGGGGGADVGHSLTIVSPQIGYLSAFATNICSATN